VPSRKAVFEMLLSSLVTAYSTITRDLITLQL
jgi:hypothetical protein